MPVSLGKGGKMKILGIDLNKLTSMTVEDLNDLQIQADALGAAIYNTLLALDSDCGDCDGRDGDCACCPNY